MADKKAAAKKADSTTSYDVLVGLNYATANGEVRAESGTVVPSDGFPPLPDSSVPWLLDLGVIRKRVEA